MIVFCEQNHCSIGVIAGNQTPNYVMKSGREAVGVGVIAHYWTTSQALFCRRVLQYIQMSVY